MMGMTIRAYSSLGLSTDYSSRILVGIVLATFVFTLAACQKSESKKYSNRLVSASSPYLREHADNPVDWYEWGSEALDKAAQEDKPVIISIGYAACHWCHVMEEESFMDTTVARLMNENFIAIKIDREERPDIDQVYITAAQLISGNAGWPLNAFALPDGKPFYAGTYFTKDQWIRLLTQVATAYRDDNLNLVKQANAITRGILENEVIKPTVENPKLLNDDAYKDIVNNWEPSLDYQLGGLSGAPKFPMPVVWEFLLQNYYHTQNSKALEAVTVTLDKMARGGIYDHLAGGFARYSTNAEWTVPHFEKMLYDNGQLVSLYAHAYQVTMNPRYAKVVKETLDFMDKEMKSSEGGFYSSLNADSEGEEGTFYVWTKEEIESILDKKAFNIFADYYSITAKGNWENKKNILYHSDSLEEVANRHQVTVSDLEKILMAAREQLLIVRNKRIHPSLDDKILTSWNALMLSAYVDAYWALEEPVYLDVAINNAKFLKENMLKEDGKLWRSYANGKPSIDAFLDDYALLANASIKLYQATFDMQWLSLARSVTDYAILHFQDEATGFFYYTSNSSQLIARKMEVADQVIPSSNSVMAEVLFKLGEYYSDDRYLTMSNRMLNQVTEEIGKEGLYYANWARLLGMHYFQPYEVAIMGDASLDKAKSLMTHYLPNVLLMGGTSENLPLLENKSVEGKTIIYVCRDKVCKLPVTEVDRALAQIHLK